MKSKFNSTPMGAVLGILVPILSIFLVYLIKFKADMSLDAFVDSLFLHHIYTKVMALGVYFGNIVLFFLFIKLDWLKAARGVLLATILYSLAIVLFRIGM